MCYRDHIFITYADFWKTISNSSVCTHSWAYQGYRHFSKHFLQTVNGSENSNQLCVSYALTVRKSVRNAFSRNLETWILKIERLWSKQTVKKLNLWGKTVVDKSTWIKDCGRKVCRKILCTYKMDDISKNYGNTYKVNELLERLS